MQKKETFFTYTNNRVSHYGPLFVSFHHSPQLFSCGVAAMVNILPFMKQTYMMKEGDQQRHRKALSAICWQYTSLS